MVRFDADDPTPFAREDQSLRYREVSDPPAFLAKFTIAASPAKFARARISERPKARHGEGTTIANRNEKGMGNDVIWVEKYLPGGSEIDCRNRRPVMVGTIDTFVKLSDVVPK